MLLANIGFSGCRDDVLFLVFFQGIFPLLLARLRKSCYSSPALGVLWEIKNGIKKPFSSLTSFRQICLL